MTRLKVVAADRVLFGTDWPHQARATYELLRDEFEFEPRGTVSIKGKGDVETWYLIGRRPGAGP